MSTLLEKCEYSLAVFFFFFICTIYLSVGLLLTSLYFYLAGGTEVSTFSFYFIVMISPAIAVIVLFIGFAEYIFTSCKEYDTKKEIKNKFPISSFVFAAITLPIWLNIASKILLFFNQTNISKILFNYRYESILYVFLLLLLFFFIPKKNSKKT